MINGYRLLVLLISVVMTFCASSLNLKVDYNTIPLPISSVNYDIHHVYTLDKTSYITYDVNNRELITYATLLQEIIEQSTNLFIEISPNESEKPELRSIDLAIDDSINEEDFRICVMPDYISVVGGSNKGILYAVQQIRKLLPQLSLSHSILSLYDVKDAVTVKSSYNNSIDFPSVELYYKPQLFNRAVLINSLSKEIDQYTFNQLIDILSLHGINQLYLNFNLSDDMIKHASQYNVNVFTDLCQLDNIVDSDIDLTEIYQLNFIPSVVAFNDFDSLDKINLLPIMALINDLQWSVKINDAKDFLNRVQQLVPMYNNNQYPFNFNLFQVNCKVDRSNDLHNIFVSLSTYDDNLISYSVDGNSPIQYTDTLVFNSSCEVQAMTIREKVKPLSVHLDIDINKATFCPIKCDTNVLYNSSDADRLDLIVNGVRISNRFIENEWIAFNSDKDIEIMIDLGEEKKIKNLLINSYIGIENEFGKIDKSKILCSNDNSDYTEIEILSKKQTNKENGIANYLYKLKSQKTRYLKLIINANNAISNKSLSKILIDEICIN